MALPQQVGDELFAGEVIFKAGATRLRLYDGKEDKETALSILLQADSGNGAAVKVGTQTLRPLSIQPGGTLTVNISKLREIWVEGAVGARIGWLAVSTSGCMKGCASCATG